MRHRLSAELGIANWMDQSRHNILPAGAYSLTVHEIGQWPICTLYSVENSYHEFADKNIPPRMKTVCSLSSRLSNPAPLIHRVNTFHQHVIAGSG
jgi:hypothetical protein